MNDQNVPKLFVCDISYTALTEIKGDECILARLDDGKYKGAIIKIKSRIDEDGMLDLEASVQDPHIYPINKISGKYIAECAGKIVTDISIKYQENLAERLKKELEDLKKKFGIDEEDENPKTGKFDPQVSD